MKTTALSRLRYEFSQTKRLASLEWGGSCLLMSLLGLVKLGWGQLYAVAGAEIFGQSLNGRIELYRMNAETFTRGNYSHVQTTAEPSFDGEPKSINHICATTDCFTPLKNNYRGFQPYRYGLWYWTTDPLFKPINRLVPRQARVARNDSFFLPSTPLQHGASIKTSNGKRQHGSCLLMRLFGLVKRGLGQVLAVAGAEVLHRILDNGKHLLQHRVNIFTRALDVNLFILHVEKMGREIGMVGSAVVESMDFNPIASDSSASAASHRRVDFVNYSHLAGPSFSISLAQTAVNEVYP